MDDEEDRDDGQSMVVGVVGSYEVRIIGDHLTIHRGEEFVCLRFIDGLDDFVKRNGGLLRVRLDTPTIICIFSRAGEGWKECVDNPDLSHWTYCL